MCWRATRGSFRTGPSLHGGSYEQRGTTPAPSVRSWATVSGRAPGSTDLPRVGAAVMIGQLPAMAATTHVGRQASGVRVRMAAVRYPVDFDIRHLDQLSGPLLTGIIELVWNSVDADAHHIDVRIHTDELTGVREVEVVDDGHGFDQREAHDGFLTLGSSAKAGGARSRIEGRPMHGSKGQGRFQLFRHGGVARWHSVTETEDGERAAVRVTLRHGDDAIEIEDVAAADAPVGTRVTISDFGEAPVGLQTPGVADRLLSQFALCIDEHQIAIVYDGQPIDPAAVREASDELVVPAPDGGDPLGMTVVQWSRRIGKQDIYLCDGQGSTLERVPSNVVAPPTVNFTAYLRWDGFTKHVDRLVLSDFADGELGAALAAARRKLEGHFESVGVQRRRRVIADWRREGVYPYEASARAGHADPARDTFDLIALEAAETINKGPKPSRRLSLRLLQEALERNPTHIHIVLDEVLRLPSERLDELVQLLERTQLSSIIKTSRSVADRLDFLEALAQLTCDPEISTDVLERQHLHRILENETWVFGEEYGLACSEAGLTQVLERHVACLGRTLISPEPVRGPDGKMGRVDLMMSQAVEHSDDTVEHLVVELKRPNVKIGSKELQQVKDYAFAVADDIRFKSSNVKWEFWAVSTDVSDQVDRERRQRNRAHGLVADNDEMRIWVKTWAEVLASATHRMKYVQRQIGVASNSADAFRYLHRVHADRLPDGIGTSQVQDATMA